MEFSAKQIASFIGGIIEGDSRTRVNNISKIDESKPNTLSFLSNPKYNDFIYSAKSSIILIKKDLVLKEKVNSTLIRVDDPYFAFCKILQMINSYLQKTKTGISSTAIIGKSTNIKDSKKVWISDYVVIGENVQIEKDVQIYPHVYIGDNCIIGEGTILYSGVKIYNNSILGKRCILHSGVVLGSDGFGFAKGEDGSYTKIPQLGNVELEDDIEIGANTTIDCATMGSTRIKKGTKLDNLIMVAHNCEIGKNNVIASQSGFSGSTKVGNDCMIGGQVGISGHIEIGNNVTIAAQSGIANNIKSKSIVMGSPAFDASKYKRAFVLFKNLEDIALKISKLEKLISK